MCGIACVVGNNKSPLYCYEALEKLEYRGYDSAGIACLKNQEILICKKEGRVKNIKEFSENTNSFLSISHTRWATHGKPSKENSHPHLSFDNRVAIVHNGIIENYQLLKKEIEDKEIKFVSDTDSECLAHYLALEKGDEISNIIALKEKVKGSYAIAILDKNSKKLYGIRKKNPLYVAKTTKGTMLVSDIMCFSNIAKEYYLIKENEVVEIDISGEITIYNQEKKVQEINCVAYVNVENEATKQGFEYFMEKEINEIPVVIKNIITYYKNSNLLKGFSLDSVKEIKLVGCGTAYHACLYGAKVLEKYLRIPSNAYIASEFKYSNPILDKDTVTIFVSQSGETMDTIGSAELVKESGVKVVAITNATHSYLAQIADITLPVFAGKEIAVASTKAYVAQILVLYILARYLSDNNYDFSDLTELPNLARDMLTIDAEIVELIKHQSRAFFIGRGIDSVTSLEASLKLKEISYKSSEGYPAGELKHGTIALIEDDTPVIVFATEKELINKVISAGEEVKSRGAKVIFVSHKNVDKKHFDYKINMPNGLKEELCAILCIIPFQLLAFETSKALGYNPDKPRNLAKSVTVE